MLFECCYVNAVNAVFIASAIISIIIIIIIITIIIIIFFLCTFDMLFI